MAKCPHCAVELLIPPGSVVGHVKCGRCGQTFTPEAEADFQLPAVPSPICDSGHETPKHVASEPTKWVRITREDIGRGLPMRCLVCGKRTAIWKQHEFHAYRLWVFAAGIAILYVGCALTLPLLLTGGALTLLAGGRLKKRFACEIPVCYEHEKHWELRESSGCGLIYYYFVILIVALIGAACLDLFIERSFGLRGMLITITLVVMFFIAPPIFLGMYFWPYWSTIQAIWIGENEVVLRGVSSQYEEALNELRPTEQRAVTGWW